VSAVCSIQLSCEDCVYHVLSTVKQADIIHSEAVVLLSDLGLSKGMGLFSINRNSRVLKMIWQLT
jgi:hypothetical protein